MKKIFYITAVLLKGTDAQSNQIRQMAEAFYISFGPKFRLLSLEFPSNPPFYKQIRVLSRHRLIRYLTLMWKTFFLPKDEIEFIFSREIGIVLIAVVRGIPSVYEIHKQPASLFSSLLLKLYSLSEKSSVVTISNSLKQFLEKRFIPSSKLIVLHDGISSSYGSIEISKEKLRSTLGLPINKFIVLHTGHLYHGRGFEFVGEILSLGSDVFFVQVGGHDPDLSNWKKAYSKYDNILFVPPVKHSEIEKYQMSADLLYHGLTKDCPTWWCCSPLKVFEYMASGVPIISTRIGSTAEVLNESNSFRFDYEKEGDLSSKVNSIRGNLKDAFSRASHAKKQVFQEFTWENRVKTIAEFVTRS